MAVLATTTSYNRTPIWLMQTARAVQ